MVWEPYRVISNDTLKYGLLSNGEVVDHCINRFNTKLTWEWKNTPSAQLVKQLLSPLEDVIKFTRVFALIRKPGEAAPTHTDIAYKHSYDIGYATKANLTGNSIEHHTNNYAAIRIPLTELSGNNGMPYLYMNNKPYYYDAGNNFFVLDEVRNAHGADPVDFHRGVIFVDGFVDFEKLEELKIGDLKLTSERSTHDWTGDMSTNFDIVFN